MRRFAQAPPMGAPPAPPMAPPAAAPAGMPGMPPGMPGMPPPAAAPMSQDAPKQQLVGPLDSVSKILYDYDIGSVIDGDAAKSPEDVALEVWEAYGGSDIGHEDEDKIGHRTTQSVKESPEAQEKERQATENHKWQRLPEGKTIEDITSLDELSEILSGLALGSVKSKAAPPGGAPGGAPPPGGMPPPMAAVSNLLQRYASMAEANASYDVADTLDALAKWMTTQ